ncbi:hypothetical protein VTJ04DRAFT_507 [Mycothermus thermophilus]|uniref:uncharacterized protein n=1 Tax=Humicola insolens TaxID=85995 RepID=UPI003742F2A8
MAGEPSAPGPSRAVNAPALKPRQRYGKSAAPGRHAASSRPPHFILANRWVFTPWAKHKRHRRAAESHTTTDHTLSFVRGLTSVPGL